MWFTLALATLTCIVVLYLPGFLLGQALCLGRFSSVVIAPAFSVCGFAVAGIILYRAGIQLPAWGLFLVVTGLFFVVFGISKLIAHWRPWTGDRLISLDDERDAIKLAALYVAIALIVTYLVFIASIHTPDGFCRRDDNTVHLSIIRGFLDTGIFSTLDVSVYLDHGAHTEFYPAAWHVLVAIVASVFGDGVALATNASIIACTAMVFPLAMCLLMQRLFGGKRKVVIAGSLFVPAFCGFPWGFLVRGQLCPNMLSYMLAPIALLLLMELVDRRGLWARLSMACGFAIALLGIACAHPNGAFTFGIMAVLWGVTRIFYQPGQDTATVSAPRIVGAVLLFACACGVWYVLFRMPQLQSAVSYPLGPRGSWYMQLMGGLLFRFSTQEGIQPLLTVFTLVGLVWTCRNRKYLWISVAYVFALVQFLAGASIGGFFARLVAGFWYSDPTRTGAMAALFAIPLCACGFAWIAQGLSALVAKIGKGRISGSLRTGIPVAILVVLLALTQFVPFTAKVGKTEFGLGLEKVRSEVNFFYSWNSGLTAEEDAFIKKAMEIIPADAVVINVPSDGSCWSYGVEGLNTYFRRSVNRGLGGVTNSKVLRMHLKDVARSKDVQDILREYNARYLLILDDQSGNKRTTVTTRYEPENWKGIESITENTPGFKLLLSEGDMRLYEIDF